MTFNFSMQVRLNSQFGVFFCFSQRVLVRLQAIDHVINSAAKTYYMSAGQIAVHIVFFVFL